jgi:ArsR family transcriptional regulator, arsenate/arsenite/antimonite-responsive transcriptional repressor
LSILAGPFWPVKMGNVTHTRHLTAEERAKVFKALADPTRIDIVDLLAKGSQCGTTLADSLGISLALLCHHWEVLVDAGILKKERVGQLRVCTLDLDRVRQATGTWERGSLTAGPKRPKRAPTTRRARR